VPTSSSAEAAIPTLSPRPTLPEQVSTRAAVIPDPALIVGSVQEAADARRAEWGPATHSKPGPADQIPQPVQIPDYAPILEGDRFGMVELPKGIQDQMPKDLSPAQEVVNEARAYRNRTSRDAVFDR